LSEGGLAVALAEMAFAGGHGIDADLRGVERADQTSAIVELFAESNTRFLIEVEERNIDAVREIFVQGAVREPIRVGTVTDRDRLRIRQGGADLLVDESLADLKAAWQRPLAGF